MHINSNPQVAQTPLLQRAPCAAMGASACTVQSASNSKDRFAVPIQDHTACNPHVSKHNIPSYITPDSSAHNTLSIPMQLPKIFRVSLLSAKRVCVTTGTSSLPPHP
ncbi:hypothetical protein IAQ61_006436 [Plenodomus lingam]|uniref:uncharacterized protein n=1 Tax=Leptosphaeria maculans TaxID=5022 RepID=UPI003317AFBD|nr:hypothetical protein IAQ61_006436 [Plenodomus lingam]